MSNYRNQCCSKLSKFLDNEFIINSNSVTTHYGAFPGILHWLQDMYRHHSLAMVTPLATKDPWWAYIHLYISLAHHYQMATWYVARILSTVMAVTRMKMTASRDFNWWVIIFNKRNPSKQSSLKLIKLYFLTKPECGHIVPEAAKLLMWYPWCTSLSSKRFR